MKDLDGRMTFWQRLVCALGLHGPYKDTDSIAVYETWDGRVLDGQAPAFTKLVQRCTTCGQRKVTRL